MQEINKSRKESRSIVTAPVSAEEVCFPSAEQAALLLRQTQGRKDKRVALMGASRYYNVSNVLNYYIVIAFIT